MIDVNISVQGDIDHLDDVELDSEYAQYMQQLSNIFNAESGEICCGNEMAINLEYYVYELNVNENYLKEKILESIHNYCTLSSVFRTSINVMFGKGVLRDTCLIDINVEDKFGVSKSFPVFIR